MNRVLSEIVRLIEAAAGKPDFLDALFGENKEQALQGKPVVIFGSGSLGKEICSTLTKNGVQPVAFCDNDFRKAGSVIERLPVISFDELLRDHGNSLIVIAALKHRAEVARQLLEAGFSASDIACLDESSDFIYMYSMVGTQVLFSVYESESQPESYLDFLISNQDKIAQAHELLQDAKSKALLISKLALMASRGNFELFRTFISNFSEPYREFGLAGYNGTPEDHYYFNNDVIDISDGEIYVDVGAYDGDTIETFIKACRKKNVEYREIIAFEPDSVCFSRLLKQYGNHPGVSCYRTGLWSDSTTLRFKSSENAIHDQAGEISDTGDVEIEVFSLDDFLKGRKVTFIKMDPGGNVIPQVLLGAAETIRKYRPKLAAGAYHGADSIFEIPLLVHKLCPDYRISLRHGTFHLCDTDLFATCQE